MTSDTESRPETTERESGFVTMHTQAGNTYELFILSKDNFNDLQPQEEDFQSASELAAVLKRESRLRYNALKATFTDSKKPASGIGKILYALKK